MCAEARIEGVIGGVADKGGVARAHRKKGREAVDQGGPEAFVDAGLAAQMAVEVFGGVEWVVSFGNIAGENGGVQSGVVPAPELESLGKSLAIHADVPGKQARGFELGFAVPGDRGLVVSGQSREREAAVLVEIEKVVVALRGSLGFRVKRIGDVLDESGPVGFEETPNFG